MSIPPSMERLNVGNELMRSGSREMALLTTALLLGLMASGIKPVTFWDKVSWTSLFVSSACCGFSHSLWGLTIISDEVKMFEERFIVNPPTPKIARIPLHMFITGAVMGIQLSSAIAGFVYVVGIFWE